MSKIIELDQNEIDVLNKLTYEEVNKARSEGSCLNGMELNYLVDITVKIKRANEQN